MSFCSDVAVHPAIFHPKMMHLVFPWFPTDGLLEKGKPYLHSSCSSFAYSSSCSSISSSSSSSSSFFLVLVPGFFGATGWWWNSYFTRKDLPSAKKKIIIISLGLVIKYLDVYLYSAHMYIFSSPNFFAWWSLWYIFASGYFKIQKLNVNKKFKKSKEIKISHVEIMRFALKVIPPVYSHRNYNKYSEHSKNHWIEPIFSYRYIIFCIVTTISHAFLAPMNKSLQSAIWKFTKLFA